MNATKKIKTNVNDFLVCLEINNKKEKQTEIKHVQTTLMWSEKCSEKKYIN